MANYLVTDTELTSVANAIRTKGGTESLLEFPSEFVSAIAAIPTGGSSDFNTATVTVTGVVTQGGMMPSVIVSTPHISETIGGTEIISQDEFIGNEQVVALTVVLYKGTAIVFSENTITDLSGDITYSEDDASFLITGDCSFTVTDAE